MIWLGLSLSFKPGTERERQPGYPVPVPNLKRATFPKPTMCDHASGSTRLGSKGRVRVIVELRLS